MSFEPVIDPEQVYSLYEKTKEFVDVYKIGKFPLRKQHQLARVWSKNDRKNARETIKSI